MGALDCGTITLMHEYKAQFLDSLMDKRLAFFLYFNVLVCASLFLILYTHG